MSNKKVNEEMIKETSYNNSSYQQGMEDQGNFGWAVLGFFFPIVGLILFLCWQNTKKKSAKQAGIGALVGFLLKTIMVPIIIGLFGAFFYFGIWPEIQTEIVQETCENKFGSEYRAVKADEEWYCRSSENGEMIKIDGIDIESSDGVNVKIDDDGLSITTNESNYIGGYKTNVNAEGDYGILFLRNDGVFSYDNSTIGCNNPLVGNYTISGNNIIFNGKVTYECNACFNTNNVKYFTGTIVDNNTIVINDNESVEYKKDLSLVENSNSLKKYVINPINGQTPDGLEEPWIDCNN